MQNKSNQFIYRLWSPIYDLVFRPIFGRARQRAIQMLELKTGEKLLIPGVGTGLDLPFIPAGVQVTGFDLSPAMLEKAKQKSTPASVDLRVMDAQQLELPDQEFDAVLLNLVLSVVPDGKRAFEEAWRVLRPGGRMVIFDKFLPEQSQLTAVRRIIGAIIRQFGTDPNRHLSDILDGAAGLSIVHDEPSLLNGQYRIVKLSKIINQ